LDVEGEVAVESEAGGAAASESGVGAVVVDAGGVALVLLVDWARAGAAASARAATAAEARNDFIGVFPSGAPMPGSPKNTRP
jgi:hypothetical protein